jgi:WD40 repeat protein
LFHERVWPTIPCIAYVMYLAKKNQTQHYSPWRGCITSQFVVMSSTSSPHIDGKVEAGNSIGGTVKGDDICSTNEVAYDMSDDKIRLDTIQTPRTSVCSVSFSERVYYSTDTEDDERHEEDKSLFESTLQSSSSPPSNKETSSVIFPSSSSSRGSFEIVDDDDNKDDEGRHNNAPPKKKQRLQSSPTSGVDKEVGKTQPLGQMEEYYLFAVCGGRHFAIYEYKRETVRSRSMDDENEVTDGESRPFGNQKQQQNESKTPSHVQQHSSADVQSTHVNIYHRRKTPLHDCRSDDERRDLKPHTHINTTQQQHPPPQRDDSNPQNQSIFQLYQDFQCSDPNEDFTCVAFTSKTGSSIGSSVGGRKYNHNNSKNNQILSSGGMIVDDNDIRGEYLCVAGKSGNIFVLDILECKLSAILDGTKRNGVFDLQASPMTCHPYQNSLLAAAALEEIRIWNMATFSNICVFGFRRIGGHVGDIYSIGWNASGTQIVSGGKDSSIKVWSLDVPRLQQALAVTSTDVCSTVFPGWKVKEEKEILVEDQDDDEVEIQKIEKVQSPSQFIPFLERFPIFTSEDVHDSPTDGNTCMIDCVMFVGDLILSKSTENEIILWKPLLDPKAEPPGGISHSAPRKNAGRELIQIPVDFVRLKSFSYDFHGVNNSAFHRFALDKSKISSGQIVVSAGNNSGDLFFWKVLADDPDNNSNSNTPDCDSVILKNKQFLTKNDEFAHHNDEKSSSGYSSQRLSFSPDGKLLVGADGSSTIFAWHLLS